MNGQQAEVNPQHVINSLTNQIADNAGQSALQIAQLNAVIAQQAEQLEEYRKQEIAEMDNAVDEAVAE